MSSRYSTPDYTLHDMHSKPLIEYDYVQNGICYYPDHNQWSPAREPETSQASQPSPNDMVVDPPVVEETKPNTGTASGSNEKVPIDPALSNNLFQATTTPLKAKRHFVYDPQECYDLELPPGLPIPFLKTTAPINLSSDLNSQTPSSQSSSAPLTLSNTSSTASSAYPPPLGLYRFEPSGGSKAPS
ncbi:hypothetical protein PGT21_017994 [Puccinia graminis f. sp. tritici]|uniref:Uncharacterized protein n=1 Tax=Puccinia graminis f. sp. tritici TaxID=56615 RepID=A0A5B0PXZ7_PUCGR|nr:hypothetical protein PGT21_017994 [Puccinia graminis f. sp. tritici]